MDKHDKRWVEEGILRLPKGKEYWDQLMQPLAQDSLPFGVGQHLASNGYTQTVVFHTAVRLTIGQRWSDVPSVNERLLRGKLLVEEVMETLEAMGLALTCKDMVNYSASNVGVIHVEQSIYDPIGTADGLADIKVIANGTAVAFGIPQTKADREVWASNMTKLDENGEPIVNRCVNQSCSELNLSHDTCDDPSHLVDSNQPVGKVLKPANYKKANIARLYYETALEEIEAETGNGQA